MATFNQAAVQDLFDRVQSRAMTLGIFETVNTHEPKSKPGNGLHCAIWVDAIRPVGRASGVAAVSGVVSLRCRLYSSMTQEPQDEIDPDLLTATTTLLNAYSTNFQLGAAVADVRAVDLFGAYGESLAAQAGYVQIGSGGGSLKRIMTVTLPVIINDLWTEVA